MPTYEYACTACGHRLEAVQKFSDEPLTVCPECGEPLRKVFGAVGIVLKGSGFYKTDTRASNGNGNGKHKTEAKESVDSGSSSSDGASSSKEKSSTPSSDASSSSKSSAPASSAAS